MKGILKDLISQYTNPGFYGFLMDPVGRQTDPTKKAKQALEMLDKLEDTTMTILLDMIEHSMKGLRVQFRGNLYEPYIRANELLKRLYEQSKNALPRKDVMGPEVD